jgi:hypothetical protein
MKPDEREIIISLFFAALWGMGLFFILLIIR